MSLVFNRLTGDTKIEMLKNPTITTYKLTSKMQKLEKNDGFLLPVSELCVFFSCLVFLVCCKFIELRPGVIVIICQVCFLLIEKRNERINEKTADLAKEINEPTNSRTNGRVNESLKWY